MTNEYTAVDTELLGQMMRVAKQNPNTSQIQVESLQQAVEMRKAQLIGKLADFNNRQFGSDSEAIHLNERSKIAVYQELILLEPDNYTYYKEAGKCAQFVHDYPASIAFFTSALQLAGDEFDTLWELYKERSRSYLRTGNYARALEDGKMFLRCKYFSLTYDDAITRQKSYNVYMICESLRQLGNKVLGDQIDTTYELAQYSEGGVTDELIEDYCHLLAIPLDPQMSKAPSRPPLSRFEELKQQIPTDPKVMKKWCLGKQFYEEYQMKMKPDFSLLFQIMQEFVDLEPTDYRYPATLGGLYFKQKKYKAALPYLTKALALIAQDSSDGLRRQTAPRSDIFALHRMLGRIYWSERPYQTAIKHYELAIRAYPECDNTTALMGLMIQCVIDQGDGMRASRMGEYFRKIFPGEDRKTIVWFEDLWQDTVGGVFVAFSRVGAEIESSTYAMRQIMTLFDSLTPASEKTEKEQQQAQKAAETIKHLEEMLRLARIW